MIDWFVQTLRSYPEIAIFLSLALGYYFGSFTYKGLGLGAVTATLVAAVIIGQLEIKITGPLKPFFFLMFLFAIGYAVGPQFVRGIAKDGLPQALFAAVVCVFCLGAAYVGAKLAGYDVGSAAGLYAGSQTISASMGLATDAINRLGLSPEETKKLLDGMPVAYAVTYIFGTVGSAIVLALLGPALLGIDLELACKRYEEKHGGKKELGGPGTAWHQFELRAFRVRSGARIVGKTTQEAEALLPEHRVFIQRIRRGDKIIDATADTVIEVGDVVAVAGRRDVLVNLIGTAAEEVDDRALLAVPIEGIDVYVTGKDIDGKTLAELSKFPGARGVFLRKISRGATATDIPILPDTQLQRGDIVTIVGRTPDTTAATKMLGYPDRATDVADVAFIGAA
jgi:putative transport protein